MCNFNTRDALELLAAGTRDLGELEEAEGYYRRLVLWVELDCGKLDVETCHTRHGLAKVLSRQCKYPEAEKLHRLNLKIQLQSPIEIKPYWIATAYHNLGHVLWCQSHDAEAEGCLRNAYDRYVELFGRSDALSTETLDYLAMVVAKQGKFHDAEELYLLLGESMELPQSEDEDSDEEDSDGNDSDED